MRKATKEWVDGLAARLYEAVTVAHVAVNRVAAGVGALRKEVASGVGKLERLHHEAEDRANERHAAVIARIDELASAFDSGVGKLLERSTRSAAVAKHDRRVLSVDRVTGLPTPAPKPGGTDTAVGVLRGQPVPVVSRAPEKASKLTPAIACDEVGLVTAKQASETLGIGRQGQKALVRLCNAGEVDGAVLKPSRSGGWHAPLASFKAAYSKPVA